MIDEIRRIKLEPIQEKLAKKEGIQKQIESNKVEIEAISDPFNSRSVNLISENYKLQSELLDLEKLEEEKARIETATLSDFGMNFQEAVQFLQERGIEILLTEEDKKGIYDRNNQEKTDINGFEDLIFVHKTDYPPRNSQIKPSSESNVQYEDKIEINGKKYNFRYKATRETVHGYMNGEVGSHTGGYWDDMKYVILIPFDKVDKSNLIGGKMVDTYFKGVVNIPKGSYILCPIGEKEEIRKNNTSIEVIGYEGERALEYGDALVSALGYYEDGHKKDSWSNEKGEEQALSLYMENGFRRATHSGSKEQLEEAKKMRIYRKVGACETLKEHLNEINSEEELYKVIFPQIGSNKDNLDELFEALEEIDVKLNEEDKYIIMKLYSESILKKEVIEMIKQKHPELTDKINSKVFMPEKCEEILNYIIIKEVGKERIKEINEQKIQEVLEKKMSDFELEYDEEKGEFVSRNASTEEREKYNQLHSNTIDRINKKIEKKGIDKYIFRYDLDKLNIIGSTGDGTEEIDKALQGKEHYQGIDEFGLPSLDFEEKDDETLEEFLERLEKYTECFSRYYNGEIVDESVRFDENGEIIEELKVEKSDFAKVAESREAVSELQSGKTVREIKEAMQQQEEHANENSVSEGEEYDQ